MASLRALLRKELREHGAAVGILVACMGVLLWLSIQGIKVQEDQTSTLDFIPVYLLSYTVVAAMILSQRLVVREYQAHTQRFLETLPVQRWQVIGLKYVLGLAMLLGIGLVAVAAGVRNASRSELVDDVFATVLVAKTAGYLFCLWGGCYLIGFTGRFRQPVFFATFLLLAGTEIATDIHIMEIPPLSLVDPAVMPYERTDLPMGGLLTSLVLGTVFTVAAFGMATWREGQWVTRLSGRLSQWEKAAACTLVLLYVIVISVVDLKKPKEQFEFSDGLIIKSEVVPLELLYLVDSEREASLKLINFLEPKLELLQQELSLEKLPPVKLSLTRSLDGITFDAASLPHKDGCLLRANFLASDFDREAFSALVVHEVLGTLTKGRAQVDPHHWFLDGFAIWWTTSQPEAHLAQALWAVNEGYPDREQLEAWSALSEIHGDEVAGSLGFSLIRAMELQHGRESVLKLARQLYVRPVHQDAREWLHRLFNPLASLFEKSNGQSLESFLEQWSSWLQAQADLPEVARLSQLMVRPRGEVHFEGTSLRYRLEFEEPPPPGTRWALLHILGGAGDEPINPSDYRREAHLWPDGESVQEFRLDDEYSSGDRISVVLTVTHPHRKYPLRLTSARKVVP